MPVYEYECTECGRIQEAWQGLSDAPLTTCQQCSGRLIKLISHSTFHLKGTGWYVTDYANKSGSSTASSVKKPEKSVEKAKKPGAESVSTKKEE
jgi:putative FmdB family regulatory protein